MDSNSTTIERAIEAATHGRYLVAPSKNGSAPLLVGFHGYAEPAETQMARLQASAGCDAWTTIAIQGMHRFYERRTNTVVASWMTRQDRELAMADNAAYVAAVVNTEWTSCRASHGVLYAGFSQGVAMAFRAAARSVLPVLGLIATGGDVPPEIEPAALGRIGQVLLCRGTEDKWYTQAKFDQDQLRLRDAGLAIIPCAFDGGHEWGDAVVAATAAFLKGRRP